MAKIVEHPCDVVAEGGEVILDCDNTIVSLTPGVAHDAADELHKHADVAKDQRGGDDADVEGDAPPPDSTL